MALAPIASAADFGQVRDDQAVMIGARRLDRHPAQQRMIQIGRFEPGDIGRDLEKLFEDRQDAADDRGGQDAVADGERALHSDHLPVVRGGIEEIDRADEAEGERREARWRGRRQSPARIRRLRRRTCRVR